MNPDPPHVPSEGVGNRPPTLMLVATVGETLEAFLRGQAAAAQSHGFKVVAVSSSCKELLDFGRSAGVEVFEVNMERRVSVRADLRAVWRLYHLFRFIRPDIVHTHTPKAGLLAMLAAKMAGVPIRIYTVNGLVAAARRGRMRTLLMACERVSCEMATHVHCVSHSIERTLVKLGIVSRYKATVIGNGGSHGVNLSAFDPSRFSNDARLALRRELGTPQNALLVGFVGRFVRDKGIVELLEAWPSVRAAWPNAYLLLCGRIDTDAECGTLVAAAVRSDPSIVQARKHPDEMPSICSMIDVGVLPTWREGLPNVLLEFAAMRVPIVASRVPGCLDIVNSTRAVIVPPRNPHALASALIKILADPNGNKRRTAAAYEHVCKHFSEDRVSAQVVDAYAKYLKQARLNAGWGNRLSRCVDVGVSTLGMVLVSPLLILIGAGIYLFMGSPILFRQTRIGRHDQPFVINKFRTMSATRNTSGELLPDSARLSRFGQFLRRASLDELPQLWNVLKGEMSLIGPRPLLPQYLTRYSPHQRRRHEVKPGITGWAQVNGRNRLTWGDRFELDVWYVDHRTFSLDLKILALTLLKVLHREGVRQEGQATMTEFMGTDSCDSNGPVRR